MANKIEIDVIANDLASAALDLVKNKLMGIGGTAGMVGVAAVTMGAAIVTGLSKAKDAAQAYDQQVKELMLRTGGTAEETSRLIQTVDDAGISYETLSTAMRFAVKNGIEPNIESIARLSTEYLALNGPVERGQFLLDKFGRSGMDMARIMDMGGEAIMNMSEAVQQNLIVTDEAIRQSEEYRVNVDNLSDAWEGYKVLIGNEVIPVVSQQIGEINNLITSLQENGYWYTLLHQRAIRHTEAIEENTTAVASSITSYAAWAQSLQVTGDTMTAIEPNYQQMISLTQQLEGATAQAAQSIAYNMLMAKLSVDGLTQAEYELGVQAGVSMGIFSQKTADTALKIEKMTQMVADGKLKVDLLKAAIDQLESKNIDINVAIMGAAALGFQNSQKAKQAANPGRTYNVGGVDNAQGSRGWQTVPPGYPDDSYSVNMSSGETYSVKQHGNGGGGAVINLTYAPAFSMADRNEVQSKLMPFILQGIRDARLG